jgi:hypothetical protein
MDRQEMIEINNNIRKRVDYLSRQHAGCINVNVSADMKHEKKKCEVAIEKIFEGNFIYTECHHFGTPRISDIYVANTDTVIEIANSETEKSLDEKEQEFKKLGFKFERVRC